MGFLFMQRKLIKCIIFSGSLGITLQTLSSSLLAPDLKEIGDFSQQFQAWKHQQLRIPVLVNVALILPVLLPETVPCFPTEMGPEDLTLLSRVASMALLLHLVSVCCGSAVLFFSQMGTQSLTYTVLLMTCLKNPESYLLYSTENSTQYSVMAYMGKESNKDWIYVYVKLIQFTVHLKLTQHCKSIILHLCPSLMLACNFLFCVISLSGFRIRVMVASERIQSPNLVSLKSFPKQFISFPIFYLNWIAFSSGNHLCVSVLVAQPCPTFCNPMDCSPPGSSVHGISQARMLEWVAISFSRGSSRTRD